jgi:integrase/recombinase XerD
MRISVFTRHLDGCTRSNERHSRRCKCWKYLDIHHDNGKRELRSAKTKSWEEAERRSQAILRQHEAGKPVDSEGKKTIAGAVTAFIESRRSEARKETTIRILKMLLDKRMVEFFEAKGLRYLYQVKMSDLEEFRSTWTGTSLTRYKLQERLKSFYRYCHSHGWIDSNPAQFLGRISVQQVPTDYFTPEEFGALLEAADEEERAFLLLLRWSGLRVSDALGLPRSAVIGNRLLVYTKKTGSPVSILLPPEVITALDGLDCGNPKYYFWRGSGELETARKRWTDRFGKLVKKAGIKKRAHIHMLRDTFAVEMLLSGVPIDQVSKMLGHSSIRITEKSYLPWSFARQEQLDQSVIKSWK